MMKSVTLPTLQAFLRRLGERFTEAGDLYLLGGSALCLLGNPRTTGDVDYTFETDAASVEAFEATVADLASEMRLYADPVPIAEFVPLPSRAYERRRWVGRYGRLDVYIFDPYTIALSKIARGFEAEALKDQYDPDWQKGDSSNVAATVGYVMNNDPRFYKVRRGYYRLTKNNELLSNPSWANLACFVLRRNDPYGEGMHLQEITEQAVALKERYSDWRSDNTETPSHTVSATMSMDHRFESLPERGVWCLVTEARPETEPEPATPSGDASATTRSQAYEQVLARLGDLGEVTRLPFGRTYYALEDKIHLMFRYSKAHQRNGEIEYFLGVTPQYYERIDDLGNGYMVFVLGSADNVLLVPTEVFATWVEDTEISGSGTWPIALYQSEDGVHLERWVSGAGREDVKAFLNDYTSIQRRLTQTPGGDGLYSKKPIRVADLLNAGLLKPGDSIYTSKVPDEWATVVSAKYVTYQDQRWRYNDWGTHVTGWASINIYQQVVLARTGQTLDELRQRLRQMDVNA